MSWTTLGGDPTSGTGGAFIDHSGVIATANLSQVVAAARTTRRYFFIQNLGNSDLWVNVQGGAAQAGSPSIRIPVGAWYEPPVAPTGAIAVFSTQLGLAYTVKEVY